MPRQFKLSDWGKFSLEQKETWIKDTHQDRTRILAGVLNDHLEYLDERLAQYEEKYNMSSKTMKKKFNNGKIQETADICSWLMLLDAKNQILKKDIR